MFSPALPYGGLIPPRFFAMVEIMELEKELLEAQDIGVALFTVKHLQNGNYRFVEGPRDAEEITQAGLDALIDMGKRG